MTPDVSVLKRRSSGRKLRSGGAETREPVRPHRAPNAATTQRFILLITLFLVSSLFMMPTVWAAARPRNMIQDCALGPGYAAERNSAQNYLVTNTPAFYACLDRFNNLGHVFGVGYYLTILAPSILALLIYLLHPWWKHRFTRAVWITEDQFPRALTAKLHELSEISGLSPGKRLSFVVDATAGRANSVVFGRPGRYTVILESGMCTQLHRNPRAFAATVLHELAHIRNKDVDIAYLTLTVWRVFLIAVLIPFAVVNLWWLDRDLASADGPAIALAGTWPDLLRGLVLAVFMVCLMYLATADTLRTREMCADLEAVALGADRDCWTQYARDLSAVVPKATGASRTRVLLHAARSLFSSHPDWVERSGTLARRSSLFTVRMLTMFLAGAAVSLLRFELSWNPASQSVSLLTADTGLEHLLLFNDLGGHPASVLATAIAGILVWREVVHRADEGLPLPSGLRAGFWFGVGHLAGELLVGHVLGKWVLASPRVLMLLLPAVVPMALLWWTAGCARLWADLPVKRRRIAAAATLTVCALAFFWWNQAWQWLAVFYFTGPVFSTSSIVATSYPGLGSSTSLKIIAVLGLAIASTSGGLDIFVTAGLWLVPMLGTIRLTRQISAPLEARIATGRLRRGFRRLARPAFIGLVNGVATVIGILVITAFIHTSIWRAPWSISAFRLDIAVLTGWYFVILLVGISLSAMSATIMGEGTAIDAAVAAYCTMIVDLVVLFALSDTDGCMRPLALLYSQCSVRVSVGWDFLAQFLPFLIGLAGIISLVSSVPAALIARVIHRAVSALDVRRDNPAVDSLRRRAMRTAGLAATSALLLVASVMGFIGDASGFLTSNESSSAVPVPGQEPSSPTTLAARIQGWLYYGGQNLFYVYEEDMVAINDSVADSGAIDEDAMRRACSGLKEMVSQAEIYPPIPVAAQQEVWTATLSTIERGAEQCVDALHRADWEELSSAFDALNPQPDPIYSIFLKLESLENTE